MVDLANDSGRPLAVHVTLDVLGLDKQDWQRVCQTFGSVCGADRARSWSKHDQSVHDGAPRTEQRPADFAATTCAPRPLKSSVGLRHSQVLAWGNAPVIHPANRPQTPTEQKVAGYIAKYATKAAETTGTLDRRVGELAELDQHRVPDHARRLTAPAGTSMSSTRNGSCGPGLTCSVSAATS